MRWRGYLRRRAPSRAVRVDAAVDADLLVLAELRRLECDLAQPRRVRHYLYLPARQADAASAALHDDGYEIATECSGGLCLLVATRTQELDEVVVTTSRARLELLAEEHGGTYDGWDAARQP